MTAVFLGLVKITAQGGHLGGYLFLFLKQDITVMIKSAICKRSCHVT